MLHSLQNNTYKFLSKFSRMEVSIKSGGCGLFGDLFKTLNGIRYAEKNNLQCKIDWNEASLYYDQEHGSNVWLYYFKKCKFDFSSSNKEKNITLPFHPGSHEYDCEKGMIPRYCIHKAIEKYCEPVDQISNDVDNYIASNFSGKTLGLHIRRTDTLNGNENRKSIDLEHYITEASRWLKDNSDSTIFLATDDESVVRKFQKSFSGKVHFQNCLRSKDGNSLHGHYDSGSKTKGFAKGYEVIIDAIILSKCDFLIRTHSRVTCFSLTMNPSMKFLDLEYKYLDEVRTPWLFIDK